MSLNPETLSIKLCSISKKPLINVRMHVACLVSGGQRFRNSCIVDTLVQDRASRQIIDHNYKWEGSILDPWGIPPDNVVQVDSSPRKRSLWTFQIPHSLFCLLTVSMKPQLWSAYLRATAERMTTAAIFCQHNTRSITCKASACSINK